MSLYPNELLTESHYDNYDGIAGFSTSTLAASGYNTYLDATATEFADPLTPTRNVQGMMTWNKTKVLGENKYITSCIIYDEKQRVLQVQTLNYTNAMDVVTNQYSFSGLLLRSHTRHQKGGSTPQTYDLGTKNLYDDQQRLTSVEKNLNGSGWRPLVAMTYNDLGQIKTRKLSPSWNANAGLETLVYDYNIRGWMLGANRDFAKSTSAADHYFGFDLGYDKQAIALLGAYVAAQYNGNITGMVWKSQGDGAIRKYDFTYDGVNRLSAADFNQYNAGFNKTAGVDFSVSNLTYDANGNIKSQTQKGLIGTSSGNLDGLTYKYLPGSNKLQNVIDAQNNVNTTLGDFRSSQAYMTSLGGTKTQTAVDYDYDVNGNLVFDKNKDITSITYNHLNLPQTITISGKGSIDYVYDAGGTKIKKIVHETGQPDKTTLYLFGTYQDDILQFLPHEEGRVRPLTGGTSFTWDYFVKDHLGNVRMVLTEQELQNVYPAATLEGNMANSNDAAYVERNYYKIDAANVVDKSMATGIRDYQNNNGVPNNNPNSKTAALSEKLYKLKATSAVNGGATGLGITLKVMSGDKINILGNSYYFNNKTTGEKFSVPVEGLVSGILGSPAAAGSKGLAASASNASGPLAELLSNYLKNPARDLEKATAKPKAYINWILFDQNFQYVKGSFDRVGESNQVKEHKLTNIPVTKNGYLYVYASNESDVNVFFDNLQVTHVQGPILEETHYYPFGLTMSGISSKAAGQVHNKHRFNGGNELQSEEFSDGSGLEWYDAKNRMYDPQLGRFFQIDALSDMSQNNSPYVFGSNLPISINDPLGLQDSVRNLAPVTITGYITQKWNQFTGWFSGSNIGYTGSGWGHGPRRWVADKTGLGNNANNLFQLGLHSQLQSPRVSLTGGLLTKLKSDPAMAAFQKKIIAILKADPRFAKLSFVLKGGGGVQFGGDRWTSSGEDWGSLNENNPILHGETWAVGANALTWAVRHASVDYTAVVKTDGTMVISYHLSDRLDLSAQPGRSEAYNNISAVTGFMYHDVTGGNSAMKINADWQTVIK